ncbi:MAG: threonine synthase, partial [Candidatus Limnocylindrales bacterium]
MTTELLGTPTAQPTPKAGAQPAPNAQVANRPSSLGRERILGLRCRACGRPEQLGPNYVCSACFGPLEVAYDLDLVRSNLSRAVIEARPAGIWRYLELLPLDAPPARGLPVGSTSLVRADRLGQAIGIERLLIKDDSRNPTLSFKDRAVAVATARAVEFGLTALACASTGNLAGATAAAAAVAGLPAYVFVPADLEPAKIEHALAYGATVIPIDGTYDDVNRLCLEVADEQGWGFVNINLRPFYAEGSKTLAFEIAEQLGWRLPDVVVAPIASGAMFTKIAKGFGELVAVGLVEPRSVRFVGGQAAGCGPVAAAFAAGKVDIEPVRTPDTIVRSLAIGNPADGRHAVELARSTGGSVEAIPDEATAEA